MIAYDSCRLPRHIEAAGVKPGRLYIQFYPPTKVNLRKGSQFCGGYSRPSEESCSRLFRVSVGD